MTNQQEASAVTMQQAQKAEALSNDKFVFTYDRSFRAKLIQADPETQRYYTEIKNYLLSYWQMKARLSWGAESFRISRKLYAKLRFMGKKVQLYLALNPDDFAGTKYHGESVGERLKYKDVPFRFDIASERKLKYAKYLVSVMMEGKRQLKVSEVDYSESYQTTDELLKQRLIRLKKVHGDRTKSSNIELADVGSFFNHGKKA